MRISKYVKVAFISAMALMFSCNREKVRIKIEKFVWIKHNLNWIDDTSELRPKKYLWFDDSTNTVYLAKNLYHKDSAKFFQSPAPENLHDKIIKQLQGKIFPTCFKIIEEKLDMYDGDYYCIIYKFENETEQILNYREHIPDSLITFTKYLEEDLAKMNSFKSTKPFDYESEIQKYKKLIVTCFPMPKIVEQKMILPK